MCCLRVTPLRHKNACDKSRKYATKTHSKLRIQRGGLQRQKLAVDTKPNAKQQPKKKGAYARKSCNHKPFLSNCLLMQLAVQSVTRQQLHHNGKGLKQRNHRG